MQYFNQILKMSCVKNKINCYACNRSYIDSNYPNHLRSQGHIVNVMKKQGCSSNVVVTQDKLYCNNHDIACCMSKLPLKSNDNTQIDFSDKQNHARRKITIDNSVRFFPKSEQTKEKIFGKYKIIDPFIFYDIFIKNYVIRCYTEESSAEAEAILDELRRIRAISSKQYDISLVSVLVNENRTGQQYSK